jgi:hypothetical protein
MDADPPCNSAEVWPSSRGRGNMAPLPMEHGKMALFMQVHGVVHMDTRLFLRGYPALCMWIFMSSYIEINKHQHALMKRR